MDRFQERTERRAGKGLYSGVYACPCLFFKMALVERSRFAGEQTAGTWQAEGKRERFANEISKKHERRQAGDKNTVALTDGIQDGRGASDRERAAAGYELDTSWIQEPDEVQHPRLWRGCSLSWSKGVS